ncbi:alpha/beta hydrolase [Halobellus sp. H-GB7]|uniref:alpha/beta fold hydrolase n=1 Tax=Halobellus sp. H-GB7 TaxID=3069756 RepID=UPI0027B33176|nr:alpha/beta hydrolase [Halobellus sp. H-GB7]MDQ2055935.1 alpha/beta hydrolase [Halobellus sp. H-GB7]
MRRNLRRSIRIGAGLLLCAAGGAFWRWKRGRLAELSAGSELVETDRGVVEVARRGSGYPVLVLHGAPGGYDQGLLLDGVFGDNAEVIAPSRPGFLRTPLDDHRSFEDQAALLVALLDAIDVERPIVVGISCGGPVALQLAADYPERVAGLVLGSAITTEIDDRMYDTGNPILDPLLTSTPVLDIRSGLLAFLHRFMPDRFIENMHAEFSTLEGKDLETYVEYILTHPAQHRRDLDFVPTIFPASARIDGTLNDERWCRELPVVDYKTIECPVLVFHGEFDAAVPISHAEFVVEALPDVEFVRVDADHLAGVGPDADRVQRALQSFVESTIEQVESTTTRQ